MTTCACIWGPHDPRCCIHRGAAAVMPVPARAPVLCPVCQGRTRVEADFYPVNDGESALNGKYVPCRSCSGRGLV